MLQNKSLWVFGKDCKSFGCDLETWSRSIDSCVSLGWSHSLSAPLFHPQSEGTDGWWFYSPGLATSPVESLGIILQCADSWAQLHICRTWELSAWKLLVLIILQVIPGDAAPFWVVVFQEPLGSHALGSFAFSLLLHALIFPYPVFPRKLPSLDWEPLRSRGHISSTSVCLAHRKCPVSSGRGGGSERAFMASLPCTSK